MNHLCLPGDELMTNGCGESERECRNEQQEVKRRESVCMNAKERSYKG